MQLINLFYDNCSEVQVLNFFPERHWECVKMKMSGNERGNNSLSQIISPNVCLRVADKVD